MTYNVALAIQRLYCTRCVYTHTSHILYTVSRPIVESFSFIITQLFSSAAEVECAAAVLFFSTSAVFCVFFSFCFVLLRISMNAQTLDRHNVIFDDGFYY